MFTELLILEVSMSSNNEFFLVRQIDSPATGLLTLVANEYSYQCLRAMVSFGSIGNRGIAARAKYFKMEYMRLYAVVLFIR